MTEFTGAFPAPSWTPPAREPFVPLRPLTMGQILAGAFRALRHNPAVTLVPAIVLSLAATVLGTVFGLYVIDPLLLESGSGLSVDVYAWMSGFALGAVGWLVGRALVFGAGTLQQGVSSVDVAHAVVGRRLTPGGLRRRTRGVRAPLMAWTAIVVVAVIVGGALGIALYGAIGYADPLMGMLATLLVYPAVAVLLTWLGTKLAFVPSVLVIERLRLGAGVRRAWRLTRGQFWRTFGIRILCWAMIWIATMLVAIPVQLLVSWLASIVAGNGDMGDYLAVTKAGDAAAALIASVIGAIGLVVTTSTDALLYLDVRMRREGLDLTLSRFMEERRATTRFDPAEPDPYHPPAEIPASQLRVTPIDDARGSGWG
ncbi:MAG: hypothetical protein M3Y46_07670 [Actinomycetota bacterium]|nr:hypothetical protein [Actinomycetota bacterium]